MGGTPIFKKTAFALPTCFLYLCNFEAIDAQIPRTLREYLWVIRPRIRGFGATAQEMAKAELKTMMPKMPTDGSKQDAETVTAFFQHMKGRGLKVS